MRRIALLLALVFALPARGATISRLYDFEPDTPAVADQVNAELDNIIDEINGNLDGDNIAQNAIATGNIATAAVTTAKIASGSVTYVKRSTLNRATSDTSLVQFFSSTTETRAENMTASIITSGRPIQISLRSVPYLNGRILVQHNGGGATDNAAYVNIRRNGSTAGLFAVGQRTTSAGGIVSYPCSAFSFIDQPDGGVAQVYTLYARVATADSGIVRIENCQLDLFEL
jgi:hypothetical protein